MKTNKLVIVAVFWILLVSALSVVSAKDQSFTISYNPEVENFYEKTIDFSSTMMKVTTFNNSICKYDNSPGLSYSSFNSVFDETGGSRHSISFLELDDGTYNYYVKCKSAYSSAEPAELHVILRVSSLVTGEVIIDESSPINSEKIEISLKTSKNIQNMPELSYSYNGISYLPLTLVGNSKEFRTELVMDENLEEGVLSFRMSAYDLEGRRGVEITHGSYFAYDFVKPQVVTEFRATSFEGEIELDWKYDEKVDSFNIYRSEFANLDYLDFYKEVQGNDDEYSDDDVEKGKTYYYRITAVDFAGNEGSLSKELYGTSLFSEGSSSSGLAPQLYGTVDSFVVEINSVISELDSIISGVSSKVAKEKDLFERLDLNKKLDSSKLELVALKETISKLKDQAILKEDLEKRIDSNRVKLGIIRKGIPEELTILEEVTKVEDLSTEKQGNAIQEVNNMISEKGKERSIRESNKILEMDPLKVTSTLYNVRVDYMGGSKNEYSIISRVLESKLVSGEDQYFIEVIPESILSDSDLIEVGNINYDLIGEGNVISFETDTKNVFYSIPKVTNFRNLNDIEFSFVKVLPEDNTGTASITGFSVFESNGEGYVGIMALIIIILGLGYFLYSRNSKLSDDYFRVSNRITEVRDLLESKSLDRAKESYGKVKRLYSTLPSNEKNKLYSNVEGMYNEILIYELEEGLEKLKEKRDVVLFKQVEKRFNSLSLENKKKITPIFEKIKEDFANGN